MAVGERSLSLPALSRLRSPVASLSNSQAKERWRASEASVRARGAKKKDGEAPTRGPRLDCNEVGEKWEGRKRYEEIRSQKDAKGRPLDAGAGWRFWGCLGGSL